MGPIIGLRICGDTAPTAAVVPGHSPSPTRRVQACTTTARAGLPRPLSRPPPWQRLVQSAPDPLQSYLRHFAMVLRARGAPSDSPLPLCQTVRKASLYARALRAPRFFPPCYIFTTASVTPFGVTSVRRQRRRGPRLKAAVLRVSHRKAAGRLRRVGRALVGQRRVLSRRSRATAAVGRAAPRARPQINPNDITEGALQLAEQIGIDNPRHAAAGQAPRRRGHQQSHSVLPARRVICWLVPR